MSFGLVFRCDGSRSVGLGHVRRSCALAAHLRDLGADVRFLMRDLEGCGVSVVASSGFPVELMPTPGRGTDAGAAVEFEIHSIESVIAALEPACVVVDHYGIGTDYFRYLKHNGMLVGVIDDLADRDLTSADWLLNQNAGSGLLPYRVRPECLRLFGPRYALLRKEFLSARVKLERRFSTTDRRVLITFGGGDTAASCRAAVGALNGLDLELEIRCVVAGSAQDTGDLIGAAAESNHKVEVLRNVADVAGQMAWADLSINAGGSTCWELCTLGVPMIVFIQSPDQRLICSQLHAHGCAAAMSRPDPRACQEELQKTVVRLLASPEERREMSGKAMTLVDGRGALRCATSLMQFLEDAAADR